MLSRKADLLSLSHFIAAIDKLQPSEYNNVRSAIGANYWRLQLWLDDVWITRISKKSVTNWQPVLTVLELVAKAGTRWQVPGIFVAAARAIATVQDEYLNQPTLALETLETAVKETGDDALMLRRQRGTIFLGRLDIKKPMTAWVSTLDRWPIDDFEATLQALLAFSSCGTAAGHLGQWHEAARIFQIGRGVAQKNRQKLDVPKFTADAAYALWRSGERSQAVMTFAECLRELEALSGRKELSLGSTHCGSWSNILSGGALKMLVRTRAFHVRCLRQGSALPQGRAQNTRISRSFLGHHSVTRGIALQTLNYLPTQASSRLLAR